MKPLKTCCMIDPSDPGVSAANKNTQNWLTHLNVWTSKMVRGGGYEEYVTALNARGYFPAIAVTVSTGTPGTLNATGHGLQDGEVVTFFAHTTMPTGLTAQTTYYVVNRAANTFQVETSIGGGAIAISTAGSGVVVCRGTKGTYLLEGGTGNVYPTIRLAGQAVMDFAALFDLAFLQNAPSETYIEEIKTRSRRGTKVGLYFINYETVPQAPNVNAWFDQLDLALTGGVPDYHIVDTGVPTGPPAGWPGGCQGCDPLETTVYGAVPEFASTCGGHDAGSGSKHTWMVDVGHATLKTSAGFYVALGALLATRYPKRSVDYILVDNMNQTRTVGSSTNYTGTTETDYIGGIIGGLVHGRDVLWKRYGFKGGGNGVGYGITTSGTTENNPTYFCPGDVPLRYHEFFFHAGAVPADNAENLANMKTRLDTMEKYGGAHLVGMSTRTNGTNFNGGTRTTVEMYGFNTGTTQQTYWRGPGEILGVDYGTWDRLAGHLAGFTKADVYVVNARVGIITTGGVDQPGSFGLFHDGMMAAA